jgi:hypothetical protein
MIEHIVRTLGGRKPLLRLAKPAGARHGFGAIWLASARG